jgi:hypothetical protein
LLVEVVVELIEEVEQVVVVLEKFLVLQLRALFL